MQSQPTEEEDSAKDSTPDTTTDDDEEGPDWDTIGYVLSSDHRQTVLDSNGPRTPTGISNASDLSVTHVSRQLNGLRERGLVELLVPEDRRKGRIYGLTDTGRDVSAQVTEVGA